MNLPGFGQEGYYETKTDVWLLHYWFWWPNCDERDKIKAELSKRGYAEHLDGELKKLEGLDCKRFLPRL